jgi:DNA-binding NarL/FixJ family response regulator
MLRVMVVEDNEKLRPALVEGLKEGGAVEIVHSCTSGEAAFEYCLAGGERNSAAAVETAEEPELQAILMDVQLAGGMNGIEAAVAIRKEFPRMPVVFYSIQDDDEYYRQFRNSGILSHYAYVRKSNYLLPSMIVPLLTDAAVGRSFIDPEIESRVQEVSHQDARSPLELLEPNERKTAIMLATGLSNRQIADRMGFRDKRSVARINGQIYAAWGLNENSDDEKVARTRAAMIVSLGRMIQWDDDGTAHVQGAQGDWTEWSP